MSPRKRAVRLVGTWLVVWPVVTLALLTLEATGFQGPLFVRTFFLTAVLVPLIALVIGPVIGWSLDRIGW